MSDASAVPHREGHPPGLYMLFFAEMWERFSYYGMRGLLIFYLTQHFLFNDSLASAQYGAYTALVYIAPVVGGLALAAFPPLAVFAISQWACFQSGRQREHFRIER